MTDPDVAAEESRRARQNTKEALRLFRLEVSRQITAAHKEQLTEELVATLRAAVITERQNTDAATELLLQQRQLTELYLVRIDMLIQVCHEHGVELPPSFGLPITRH